MADKLDTRLMSDFFNPDEHLHVFSMLDVEVDGVYRHRGQDPFSGMICSIKRDQYHGYATGETFVYLDDGFPIDEKHYLETGCIRSTNPAFVMGDWRDPPKTSNSALICWCEVPREED